MKAAILIILAALAILLAWQTSARAQDRMPPAKPGMMLMMDMKAKCQSLAGINMTPGSGPSFAAVDGDGDLWFVLTDKESREWSIWFTIEGWVCQIIGGRDYGDHLMPPIPHRVPGVDG